MRSNMARFGLLGITALSIFVEFADIVAKLVMGLLTNVPDSMSTVLSLMLMGAFALYAWTILLIPKFGAEFAKPR